MRPFTKMMLALAALSFVTTMPKVRSWNDASRMATIQAIVEHHTFAIDDSVFADTGDKLFINGHFYSDKLILPSLLGAAAYAPVYLAGLRLDYGVNIASYFIILLTVKAFWLASLAAFYGALRATDLDDIKKVWLTLAFGIASLHFTWSSTLCNNSLAASQITLGFYFLLRARHGEAIRSSLFLAGFFLSFAAASDAPTTSFYCGFLVYVLARAELRSAVVYYVLPLLLTVAPTVAINYSICGRFVPAEIVREYWEYEGSPWIGSTELSGLVVNSPSFFVMYTFESFFGPKGFLLYNPFLLLALPLFFAAMRRGRPLAIEARAIGAMSLLTLLYYLLLTTNYSGTCYSIRWFLPFLPFLFFFMHPFLRDFTHNRQRLFFALFALSTVIAVIGLVRPWSGLVLHHWPIISNMQMVWEIVLQ